MSSQERLRAPGSTHLESRGLRGDLTAPCSCPRRGHGEGGAELFSWGPSDGTHANSSKLHQGRFGLDFRKLFFTKRVVRPWNRLPREVVNAPSWSGLKRDLDNALTTL